MPSTRKHPEVLIGFTVDVHSMLIDRDRVASLSRLTGVQRSTGRTISYNQAQFVQFRDGKIVEYRGIIDSYSAAEQMIGHPICAVATARARLGDGTASAV